MEEYTRYQSAELVALLDRSFESLKEVDAASSRLRQEIVGISSELTKRGIQHAVDKLE